MKTGLNERLSEILKENFENSDQTNDTIVVAQNVNTGEDETTDVCFNPSSKEVLTIKNKSGNISTEFVPLAEFKPDVYGLSSDVFDQVEQSNDMQDSTQQLIDTDVEEVEIEDTDEDFDPAREENYGFERGKNLAAIEDEPSDVNVSDFEDIEDDVLLEFAYSKGVDFTTRNKTIKILFEHNKVTKAELDNLKSIVKRNKLNEEVSLLETDDEFIKKFGELLDFRNIKTPIDIDNSDIETYEALDELGSETWNALKQALQEYNISIEYNPMKDVYVIFPTTSSINDEELYEIEEQDKQIIENIVKMTPYTLLEVKGMPKSSGKEYMLEVVVENNGRATVITYNDNKNIKPWSIKDKEFNTLKESINSIFVPFNELVSETKLANSKISKKKTLFEEIRKENWNKTKNLPLAEKEVRQSRSIDLIKSMFTESVDTETETYLSDLRRIDEKYNG